jgi:predicted P-loop ATPase
MTNPSKTESFPLDIEFPHGWKYKNDDERNPTALSVGELSRMLAEHFRDRVRFNQVKSRPEVDGVEIKDDNLQHLYVVLGELGWSIGKMAARDAWMSLAFKNAYSPVVEYLDGLLGDEAVQPVELDLVASEYLGAKGSIDGAKVAAMLIGAVNRAYKPGCKFDGCLTLKGAQGIKKSSFFKELALADWFVDTHQDKELDTKLAIHNCWIYELQELESVTGKRESGRVKALLSSSVDSFKQPYGYGISDHPRRSIFVASVNRDDFLKDTTGNRRFWVVDLPQRPELGEQIDVDRVARERDRIWKAAVLAYKAGRKPMLDLKQEIQNAADNQAVTQENWCAGVLHEWLRMRDHLPGVTNRPYLPERHFEIHEAMVVVKEAGPAATQQQVADALKELGCIKHKHQTRILGGRYRLWEAPEMEPPSKEEIEQSMRAAAELWN